MLYDMQIFQSDKVTGIVQRELGLIILTHSDKAEGPSLVELQGPCFYTCTVTPTTT